MKEIDKLKVRIGEKYLSINDDYKLVIKYKKEIKSLQESIDKIEKEIGSDILRIFNTQKKIGELSRGKNE